MLLCALLAFGSVCFSPLDPGENAGGSGGGGAPTSQNQGVSGEEVKPYAVFPSEEKLNERLARASRSTLREMFGTDDKDLIRTRWAKLDQMERDEAERERAKLSEIDRAKAEKAAAEAQANEAREEVERLKFERHVAQKCSKLGIRDVEYATYLITRKTELMGADDQLDVEEFLAEELKDKSKATAFGIAEPVVVTQVADPANTAPKGDPPPPPPPPGPAGGAKSAMDMSDDEWRKHRGQLGLV